MQVVPHVAIWRVDDGVLIGENDPALTGSMLRTEQ